MSDSDKIHRFIFDNTEIRGEIVTLEHSFQEAISNQNLADQEKKLLGSFFSAIALVSETLKFNGSMSLQIRGDGPVNLIMSEIEFSGQMRGIIKFQEGLQGSSKVQEILKNGTLQEIFGQGILTITLEPEQGERYQGIVSLEKDNLSECLENYFEQSEQLPTRIRLFSSDKLTAGILLQALPGMSVDDDIWVTVTRLMDTVQQEEIFELEHAVILYRLFNELPCRLFPEKQLSFRCSCTYERCKNAILSIGESEAHALLKERDIIEIACEFCGQKYTFGEKQVDRLFQDIGGAVH